MRHLSCFKNNKIIAQKNIPKIPIGISIIKRYYWVNDSAHSSSPVTWRCSGICPLAAMVILTALTCYSWFCLYIFVYLKVHYEKSYCGVRDDHLLVLFVMLFFRKRISDEDFEQLYVIHGWCPTYLDDAVGDVRIVWGRHQSNSVLRLISFITSLLIYF